MICRECHPGYDHCLRNGKEPLEDHVGRDRDQPHNRTKDVIRSIQIFLEDRESKSYCRPSQNIVIHVLNLGPEEEKRQQEEDEFGEFFRDSGQDHGSP